LSLSQRVCLDCSQGLPLPCHSPTHARSLPSQPAAPHRAECGWESRWEKRSCKCKAYQGSGTAQRQWGSSAHTQLCDPPSTGGSWNVPWSDSSMANNQSKEGNSELASSQRLCLATFCSHLSQNSLLSLATLLPFLTHEGHSHYFEPNLWEGKSTCKKLVDIMIVSTRKWKNIRKFRI